MKLSIRVAPVLLIPVLLLAACGPDAPEERPQGAVAPAMPADIEISDADAETIEELRDALSHRLPELTDSMLLPTPIPGIFELSRGMAVGYVTADGRYLFEGELVDLESGRQLTEERRRGARVAVLTQDGSDGITFVPEDKPDAPVVTVFTDIDCGYCRKMHQEIDQYMDAGIAIRYLLYPRAGTGSPSYDKAVSSWCNDNPQDAITRAKHGRDIESLSCEHPVDRHLSVGQRLGLRGTPMMVLPNGEVLQGYVNASALGSRINNAPMAEAVVR